VEEGGESVGHEHILTKDEDGAVWVIVMERNEIRLYPFLARTSHNGHEERKQFDTFVVNLPKDNSFYRYEYEGEEETFQMLVLPSHHLA
jgi:hypothetical protein